MEELLTAMYMFLLIPYLIYYDLFLPNYIPIILTCTVLAGIGMVYTKKYKLLIPLFIINFAIMVLISGCDYVKSRKRVDADWMIGKPLWMIEMRYSVREDEGCFFSAHSEGDLYVWEILDSDWLDGVEGGYRYYISVEDGKISNVDCHVYDLDFPSSDYDYEDRW